MLIPLIVMALAQDKNMVPAYLDSTIRKMVAGRSPDYVQAHKAELKKRLFGDLGLDPLPEKNPLNARITGRMERDGYVIEKLVYETFPMFYATCYLYLPAKGDKPYPAVVCPVGHWADKKLEPVVQARCIGLALYGFAVLCIDMPGAYSEQNDERSFPGSHNNWLLHMGSFPPECPTVWDVVRAIDYLETRPDIDSKRIGCTGTSGGGLATMYAAVVDDRITCSVPVCYPSSFEDNYNNGCYCNHVPGVMQIGDRSDVLALQAPKPILVIGASVDGEFPKAGTLRTHEKLLKHYEAAGKGGDCKVYVAQGGHDYSKEMREQMYGFMLKYLKGEGDGGPAKELRDLPAHDGDPAINVEPPHDVKSMVFPDGKAPADAKSMQTISRERAMALNAKWDAETGPGTLRERILKRLEALSPLPERCPLDADTSKMPGVSIEQWKGTFVSEHGLRIPFVYTRKPGGKVGVRIVLSEQGIAGSSDSPPPADKPMAELRLDVRGTGSLSGLTDRLCTYLGRPAIVMWAWDVSRAVDYLVTRDDADTGDIEVWGFGPAGGPAAYFAAIIDPRISHAYGERTLRSFLDAYDRPVSWTAKPARIFEVADIPLMRKAVGSR